MWRSMGNDAMVTLGTGGNSQWIEDKIFTSRVASLGTITVSISLPDAMSAPAGWSRRVLGFRRRWCKWGACWRSSRCASAAETGRLGRPEANQGWRDYGGLSRFARRRSSPQLRPPLSSTFLFLCKSSRWREMYRGPSPARSFILSQKPRLLSWQKLWWNTSVTNLLSRDRIWCLRRAGVIVSAQNSCRWANNSVRFLLLSPNCSFSLFDLDVFLLPEMDDNYLSVKDAAGKPPPPKKKNTHQDVLLLSFRTEDP